MKNMQQTLTLVSRNKVFEGWLERYKHASSSCHCDMHFSIYLPPQSKNEQLPVLYWLSGLTCTDVNFFQKAGAQRYAAEAGVILVACDTSPRGVHLPGDNDHWDFGTSAGFYLNATQAPWSNYYHMYDYVLHELPNLIESNFPVDPQRKSIFGHSMGGHGALVLALRNPETYCSVSAFAPISAPIQSPWGQKAFSHYLGENKALWEAYDASCLVGKAEKKLPILVDQGDADEYLTEQLKPEILQYACAASDYPLTLRMQAGYDHSYYFISSFISDHINHHMKVLS